MNMVTHLQELDNLIIEHTHGPVTAKLRNKVHFAIEQLEAYSNEVANQEKAFVQQRELIERLNKENQDVISKYSMLEAEHSALKAKLASFALKPEDQDQCA